ncbi:MAG: hypothetical protein ACLS4R_04290 [Roseburia inulinivorans]|jgi:hypothetical protein|nr:MAG TPA: hypothetical protein [Caudoviricetes sp.]DAW62276.1 MAG TPA: hypothetical protein [Caudoviricetes sp.]DAZ83690.1 MAG TPA: hypothetical protein [Caudoviricetes sp.]
MSKTHTSNEQKPLASEIICDLEAENAKLEARNKKLSNIVLKQAAVLVETLLLLNEEGDLGNEDAR